MINLLLNRYPELKNSIDNIQKSIETIIETYKKGGKVLIAGNGGSAADAEHIAAELLKSFIKKRPIKTELKNKLMEIDKEKGEYIADTLEEPLQAIALTSHIGLSTAYLNDKDPYLIFAQQLLAFGKEKDVFIAISTSGNAKNILYAAALAKALGIKIISLTNESGGKLSKMADIAIKAPAKETYRVQEYHIPIYHAICIEVEKYFFPLDK